MYSDVDVIYSQISRISPPVEPQHPLPVALEALGGPVMTRTLNSLAALGAAAPVPHLKRYIKQAIAKALTKLVMSPQAA